MNAILLNGPPRAGKDTIGKILAAKLPGSQCLKFAQPIVDFMFNTFGIHMEAVDKDQPRDDLHGRTPRQVAIQFSENFCKPLFGVDFFGRELLMQMLPHAPNIVTDSGFAREVLPIIDETGAKKILQIRIHRRGYSFQGDSRSYWELPDVAAIDFENDCRDIGSLVTKVYADLVPEVTRWLIHSS